MLNPLHNPHRTPLHILREEYNACLFKKAYLTHVPMPQLEIEIQKLEDFLKAPVAMPEIPDCERLKIELHFMEMMENNKNNPPKDDTKSPEQILKEIVEEKIQRLAEYDKMITEQFKRAHIKNTKKKIEELTNREQEIIADYLKSKASDGLLDTAAKTLVSHPHPIPRVIGAILAAFQLNDVLQDEIKLLSDSTKLLKEMKHFCLHLEQLNEQLVQTNDELIKTPDFCLE